MEAFVVAPAGFLLAVLWFDLMFDAQVRRLPAPDGAVASISAYYRRVTTDASPMNHLVSLAMVCTLVAVIVEITRDTGRWLGWVSLVIGLVPMVLAGTRTVPRARRLGSGTDSVVDQLAMARRILVEHIFCFVAMASVITLQLAGA